jgi:hypothetical protein
MKPVWMIHKEEERQRERAKARARARLLAQIADVCWDIDVWRDERPDTALTATLLRLGPRPTLHELRVEYQRLLRQASLRGRVPEQEEVAA